MKRWILLLPRNEIKSVSGARRNNGIMERKWISKGEIKLVHIHEHARETLPFQGLRSTARRSTGFLLSHLHESNIGDYFDPGAPRRKSADKARRADADIAYLE